MIELRPWQEGDLPLLEEAAADEYVALLERLPTPFSTESGRAWIASRRETDFAVAAGGEAVGGAGYACRHVPGPAELGYWIVARRRGEGLATAAAGLAAERASADGVERLQATVEPWNAASQRVLEKCGFVREGLLRGYAAYRGTRQDVYLYARLR